MTSRHLSRLSREGAAAGIIWRLVGLKRCTIVLPGVCFRIDCLCSVCCPTFVTSPTQNARFSHTSKDTSQMNRRHSCSYWYVVISFLCILFWWGVHPSCIRFFREMLRATSSILYWGCVYRGFVLGQLQFDAFDQRSASEWSLV